MESRLPAVVLLLAACSSDRPATPPRPAAEPGWRLLHLASPMSRWDQSLTPDAGGFLFSGRTYWPTIFAGQSVEAGEEDPALLLARLGGDGELAWLRTIRERGDEGGTASVPLAGGDALWIIDVSFGQGALDLGSGDLIELDPDRGGVVLLVYDASGERRATAVLDRVSLSRVLPLADGSFAVAGHGRGSSGLRGGPLTCDTCTGPIIARFGADLSVLEWRSGTDQRNRLEPFDLGLASDGFWMLLHQQGGGPEARASMPGPDGPRTIETRGELVLARFASDLTLVSSRPLARFPSDAPRWGWGARFLWADENGALVSIAIGETVHILDGDSILEESPREPGCGGGRTGRVLVWLDPEGRVDQVRSWERPHTGYRRTSTLLAGDAGLVEIGNRDRDIYTARVESSGAAGSERWQLTSSGGSFELMRSAAAPGGSIVATALAGHSRPYVGSVDACELDWREGPSDLRFADGEARQVQPGLYLLWLDP